MMLSAWSMYSIATGEGRTGSWTIADRSNAASKTQAPDANRQAELPVRGTTTLHVLNWQASVELMLCTGPLWLNRRRYLKNVSDCWLPHTFTPQSRGFELLP